MAIIKVKKDFEGGLEYLKNVCDYIYNPKRAVGLGGNGVNPYHSAKCYEQMLAVKKYYAKTTTNPLVHFIISYNIASAPDIERAVYNTRKIAEYFHKEYQTLYCTHSADHDCSWFHGHILVNSVSFVDGKMFSTGGEEMKNFQEWVNDITQTNSFVVYWSKKKDEEYRKKKAKSKANK